MKKILIADDHQVVRKGLKQILEDEFSDVEFGEAENAAETLQKVSEKKWDLLILDINMPGRSGLEVLHQLKEEKNMLPVLVLSMHAEEQIAVRTFKSGAWGYLSKDAADTDLVKAIHQILSGKKYISPRVAELLAEQLENPSGKAPHEHLSDREYETFIHLAKGKTVSQIAKEVSLSIPTVSTFRTRALDKMKMETNSDLIRYAVDNKLI
ncbi:MAG: response regulator transcription factor [Bacteroidetes bacterium]|nr:response regulator transcription factor [Bacteroidota bacterium]